MAQLAGFRVERRVVRVGVHPRREAMAAPTGDPVAARMIGAVVNGMTSPAFTSPSVGDPTVVEWTRRTGRAVLEVTETTLHIPQGRVKTHRHRRPHARRGPRRELAMAAGGQTAGSGRADERHVAIEADDVGRDPTVVVGSGSAHERSAGRRSQPPAGRDQRHRGEDRGAGREPPRPVSDGCFLRHRRRLVSGDPAHYEAATRKPRPRDEAQVGSPSQGKCVGI